MFPTTGYIHPCYADSLAEFGTPRELPRSRGWILERQLRGFADRDAMFYPVFACQDWSQLHTDLEDLAVGGLLSLAVVVDPFGTYDLAYLRHCFPDVMIPYKEHFVIDLTNPCNVFVSNHHQRYARKGLRTLHVQECEQPTQFIDIWADLYSQLINRHNIRGIAQFSKPSFLKQLLVPGMVMFRAVHHETTVGMTLWYVQGNVGYYHLGAYTDTGYALHASFAIFWYAINYFAARSLEWIDLGGAAGANGGRHNHGTGLTRFKQGWSTGTRMAYFCGRIFNRPRYAQIVETTGISATDYFPIYRRGEFS